MTPLTPTFLVGFHPHGLSIHSPPPPACRGVPMDFLRQLQPLTKAGWVMDGGLAAALDCIAVLGHPARLDQWRRLVEQHLAATVADPVERWLCGTDTGSSSHCILHALTGRSSTRLHKPAGDTPHDADDFGRCHRLLGLFPEWRARLGEVAARWPESSWPRLVPEWDRLTELHLAGRSTELSQLIRQLTSE